MNETRRDECVRPARVMTQVSFFHSAGGVHVEISFFAEGAPPGPPWGASQFVRVFHPLATFGCRTNPRDLCRPWAAVAASREESRSRGSFLQFMYSLRTQSKAAKPGGSQANRSRPISSFMNQSPPLDLDGEQCPWTGTASISPLAA